VGYYESQQRRSQSAGDRIRHSRQPGIVGSGRRDREQFERDTDAIIDTDPDLDANTDRNIDNDYNANANFRSDLDADGNSDADGRAKHADRVSDLAEQRKHGLEYRAHPGVVERQCSADADADLRRWRDDRLDIVYFHVMRGKFQLEYEKSFEGDTLDNSIGLQFEWDGGDQRRGERDEVSLRRE
jgi:hypothetical protein